MSNIIFLNGAGSAGKTSIAQALQAQSPTPWLRLGIDTFIDMMPEQYIAFGAEAKEGYFEFIASHNERGPCIQVEDRSLGYKFFELIPAFIGMLADHGHQLIVDEVLFGDDVFLEYVKQLHMHRVYFIGVYCEFQTLQQRESQRADRLIGLANGQFDSVHAGIRHYDLIVDTTHSEPAILANQILTFVAKTPNPTGFKKIKSSC